MRNSPKMKGRVSVLRVFASIAVRVIELCAVFVLLILAARAMGSTQPPPQALKELHLTDCALPCWLGITPGKTTFDEAVQRVSAAYPTTVDTSIYRDSVYADYQAGLSSGQVAVFAGKNGIVREITLITSYVEGMTLGDLVNLYGSPDCFSKYPVGLTYISSQAFADVLANSEAQNQWRRSINNIDIHSFEGFDKASRCGPSRH